MPPPHVNLTVAHHAVGVLEDLELTLDEFSLSASSETRVAIATKFAHVESLLMGLPRVADEPNRDECEVPGTWLEDKSL
jgi:hypothetical protein